MNTFVGRCECGSTKLSCSFHGRSVGRCGCFECRSRTDPAEESVFAWSDTLHLEGPYQRYSGEIADNMVEKVFCAVCGTMIYAIEPSGNELAYVHVSTLSGFFN